ncbi:tripartite tricarboxylate transporter substrate binding protein [Ramlibacter tataouinensis]|uniref:Bug family tripartite tricarboxylate transporter substrate binding protein n=1 Tax=Ramlibacter tataouinensis TaxID=94132 RepID=UPI0022F3E8C1|nr:tripartite tricarboxylate transporter substrate binding protein [Ramlibacter tataouinensis]WBY01405.1 tripartite tricarboxylate transporter substrate binding protein [Ramlibacter tataouinensis]
MTKRIPSFLASRRALLAAATLALASPFAAAQAFPDKPVKLLVGYNAGGGVDAMARLLSARLPALLGQQVVVENRSGASGMIAAEAVANAAPDGYTLLLGESGMMITSLLQPRGNLDPIKSFTPVAGAFVTPLMVVAGNSLPANNPKELLELIKAKPGGLSYATSGVGTVHHLGFEMLKARSQSFIVHIPYRGASQIVPDVIGGQVPIGVVSAAAGLTQANAGKLKAIGMMSAGKLAGAEKVPAFADALPGFDVAPRLFVLAPAGTPAPVVAKLDEALRKVLSSAELEQAASRAGGVVSYLPPAQLGQAMARETADWSKLIKSQKIAVQ